LGIRIAIEGVPVGVTKQMEAGASVTRLEGKSRRILVIALPAVFSIAWLIFVFAAGHFERVTDNRSAALTMAFGSFVAGSTPQGGGAVAFPVFTKLLGIPSPVARSFSLVIQASGMVMASASILLSGTKIDWKALRLGVMGSSVGFVLGLFLLGDPSTPFGTRDSTLPT